MRFFAIFKLITITISTITARPFDLRADFNSLSSDTIVGSSPNSPDHFRTNRNGNFMQVTPVLLPRHPNGGLEFFFWEKFWKVGLRGGRINLCILAGIGRDRVTILGRNRCFHRQFCWKTEEKRKKAWKSAKNVKKSWNKFKIQNISSQLLQFDICD